MKILSLINIIVLTNACISPIDYIEPPICNGNIKGIGLEKALKYGKLFFGDVNNILSKEQFKCITYSKFEISKNIRKCVEQITINNNTNAYDVAKGLAYNDNNKLVSACAKGMPCIEFNNYVGNSSFTKLVKYCNATKQFENLFNDTNFIKCSFYGYEFCQKLYPEKCLYLEKEPCSKFNYLYACPVSRWIYASNFMLLYILNPLIAARMPDCRIIY